MVATDIPAVQEFAGDAVYRLPPGDAAALGSAILRVSDGCGRPGEGSGVPLGPVRR